MACLRLLQVLTINVNCFSIVIIFARSCCWLLLTNSKLFGNIFIKRTAQYIIKQSKRLLLGVGIEKASG